ncbi:MAG TPA: hypothetical protein VGS01_11405 [Candidatus Limnocylindria bacterium]|jgi:hypothetical protein|nr:hypothetical protein [Candidatus Limnocylindria bacterium]
MTDLVDHLRVLVDGVHTLALIAKALRESGQGALADRTDELHRDVATLTQLEDFATARNIVRARASVGGQVRRAWQKAKEEREQAREDEGYS